jgi:AcrR family transcriptional regulator
MNPGQDPRIERSRRVIAEATIAEMADVGYGAMTVEGIAKRAGVAKSTIYRQWSGKLEIVEAALELLKADVVVDAAAPPRRRLTELLARLAGFIGDLDEPGAACFPALVSAAHYDPAVREFHFRFGAEVRQVLVDIITEGQRSGEFSDDRDPVLAAELLMGPIFYRRLMTPTSYPVGGVDVLVAAVLGPQNR